MQGEAIVAERAREAQAEPRVIAVALGSNQGDRRAHLAHAVSALGALLADMRVSPFIETAPVGVPPQAPYLNAAVVGACALAPSALLARLMRIERARGRERPFPGAARTLDLDVILMGGLVVRRPDVELPHPRFRRRRFVLEPLAAIAPDLADPVTGRTIRELLADLAPPAAADQSLRKRASRLQAPGPAAARYRNTKQ